MKTIARNGLRPSLWPYAALIVVLGLSGVIFHALFNITQHSLGLTGGLIVFGGLACLAGFFLMGLCAAPFEANGAPSFLFTMIMVALCVSAFFTVLYFMGSALIMVAQFIVRLV